MQEVAVYESIAGGRQGRILCRRLIVSIGVLDIVRIATNFLRREPRSLA